MSGISFDTSLILNHISSQVMLPETHLRFCNRFIVTLFIITPYTITKKRTSKRYAPPTSEPRQSNLQIKLGCTAHKSGIRVSFHKRAKFSLYLFFFLINTSTLLAMINYHSHIYMNVLTAKGLYLVSDLFSRSSLWYYFPWSKGIFQWIHFSCKW